MRIKKKKKKNQTENRINLYVRTRYYTANITKKKEQCSNIAQYTVLRKQETQLSTQKVKKNMNLSSAKQNYEGGKKK